LPLKFYPNEYRCVVVFLWAKKRLNANQIYFEIHPVCGDKCFIGYLHDTANVQQTSSISTCILNTFAGSLLDVCWIV